VPSSVAHASVAVLLAPLFGRDTISRRAVLDDTWKSPWQPFSGLLPEIVLLWFPAFLLYRVRRRELSFIQRADG
jgi:hypothetical protein